MRLVELRAARLAQLLMGTGLSERVFEVIDSLFKSRDVCLVDVEVFMDDGVGLHGRSLSERERGLQVDKGVCLVIFYLIW